MAVDKSNSFPKALPCGRMKRLAPEWYRGYAFVHWTYGIQQRSRDWLTPVFHARFREIQIHALTRYRLLCLVYCLMPDHFHVVWAGLAQESDQDRAASFFHKYLGRILRDDRCSLQKQAWDVVLREEDRERGALIRTAFYITDNPVRKRLVDEAAQWPYSGTQAAGYPDLDWRDRNYHERVWTIYEKEVERFDK